MSDSGSKFESVGQRAHRVAVVSLIVCATGSLLSACGGNSSLSASTVASHCESYLSQTQAAQSTTRPTFLVTRAPALTSVVGNAAVAVFRDRIHFDVCTYSHGSANQLAYGLTLARFKGKLQLVGTTYLSDTQAWALVHVDPAIKRVTLVTASGGPLPV